MTAALVARLAAVATGVWLMVAPWALGYGDPMATSDRVVGPIAGALAFVACWAVVAPLRWGTIPGGAWLVLAPAVLGVGEPAAWVSSVASGVVFVATAFVGEDVREQFGGGWRTVRPSAFRTPPA